MEVYYHYTTPQSAKAIMGSQVIKKSETKAKAKRRDFFLRFLAYFIRSRSYDGLKHCLIFPIGTIVIFHIFVKKQVKMFNLNFVIHKRHFLARNCIICANVR